jgi:arsenite methyltransferase
VLKNGLDVSEVAEMTNESDCCSKQPGAKPVEQGSRKKSQVQSYYSQALGKSSTESSCCRPAGQEKVPSFGCVFSLSKKAGIKNGDIVVDFGSGAGHDVFEAAELVGVSGRVIGIDFTPEMIKASTETALEKGHSNVEFRLGDLEHAPLPDNFADVVISNCVINLTMDKQRVFSEAYRVLKPGGRIVDADEIAAKELPSSLQKDERMWCKCIGGALTERQYEKALKRAGFKDVKTKIYGSQTVQWQDREIEIKSGIIEGVKPNN